MKLVFLQLAGCWLVASCWLVTGSSSQAQDAVETDRVVYGPIITGGRDLWDESQSQTLVGNIKQLNSIQLVLETVSGQEITIASDRIELVELNWVSAEARAAMQLVDERKYRQAISAIEQILKQGVPPWQALTMVEGLVKSALGLGSQRVAGIVFQQYFSKLSAPSLLYAEMPLCWTNQELDIALTQKAQEWLISTEEHAELLGASWLLLGESSQAAQAKLRILQSSNNKTIAKLAAAQAWRLVPPPQTMSQLQAWYDFRDSLPPPLRIGPTEFLADRLMRIGQVDLAIGQWMRIASQHADRYHRAVPALKNAAEVLQREGKTEAVQRLNEWIERLSNP